MLVVYHIQRKYQEEVNILVGNTNPSLTYQYLPGTQLIQSFLTNSSNSRPGFRDTTQCTVEKKDYISQLTALMKVDLGFEIQFLLKSPFLTVLSKIYRSTKVDVLGT